MAIKIFKSLINYLPLNIVKDVEKKTNEAIGDIDLTPYAKKTDLDAYAKKSDIGANWGFDVIDNNGQVVTTYTSSQKLTNPLNITSGSGSSTAYKIKGTSGYPMPRAIILGSNLSSTLGTGTIMFIYNSARSAGNALSFASGTVLGVIDENYNTIMFN